MFWGCQVSRVGSVLGLAVFWGGEGSVVGSVLGLAVLWGRQCTGWVGFCGRQHGWAAVLCNVLKYQYKYFLLTKYLSTSGFRKST